MTHAQPRIRMEDDAVDVALDPAVFDQRLMELVSEDDVRDSPVRIERVTYWRGELPCRRLWVERLWWGLGISAGMIFFYGLYSLVQKGLTYIVG